MNSSLENNDWIIVEKDIYDINGKLLVAKGKAIDLYTLHKLKRNYGISIKNNDNKKYTNKKNGYKNSSDIIDKKIKLQNTVNEFTTRYHIKDAKTLNYAVDLTTELVFNSSDKPWNLYMNSLINYIEWIYPHVIGSTILAVMIAKRCNYNKREINDIAIGALLHDIGKILVPKSISMKSSELTDSEYEILKKHCELGYALLKDVDISHNTKQLILQHHERLDGSGYPYGLTKKEILPETKAFMVADDFDELTSYKKYRKAKSVHEAFVYLSNNLSKYSPKAVVALRMMIS